MTDAPTRLRVPAKAGLSELPDGPDNRGRGKLPMPGSRFRNVLVVLDNFLTLTEQCLCFEHMLEKKILQKK